MYMYVMCSLLNSPADFSVEVSQLPAKVSLQKPGPQHLQLPHWLVRPLLEGV